MALNTTQPAGGNLPVIVDPLERLINVLHQYGYETDALEEGMAALDYPSGSEEEFLRHYVLGAGGPFSNFLAYVDVGVDWTYLPVGFASEAEGQEAKMRMEKYADKADLVGTMFSHSIYFEVIGRSCIILTANALGDDFYMDENADITGVDVLNPMTLTTESIRAVKSDRTGTEVYEQVSLDEDEKDNPENTVTFTQDRVIYRTRSPFTKTSSIHGISMYQNALKELRAVVKFPRYREQIARKMANIFRIYRINTEKLKLSPMGGKILLDSDSEQAYLMQMQKGIMQQEQRHSSIAMMDWVEIVEQSFGGKEPALGDVEKQTLESLALKLEMPINVMSYGRDVNRATLDTIADFFVQRRKNGAQRKHKKTIEQICAKAMELWGYSGRLEVVMNPFVADSEDEIWDRVGKFLQQAGVDIIGNTEIRRMLKLPDKMPDGDAQAIAKVKVNQVNPDGSAVQQPGAPSTSPEPSSSAQASAQQQVDTPTVSIADTPVKTATTPDAPAINVKTEREIWLEKTMDSLEINGVIGG